MTCFVATSDPLFLAELKALATLGGLTAVEQSADILLLDMDCPIDHPSCKYTIGFSRSFHTGADFVRPFQYEKVIETWRGKNIDGEEADNLPQAPIISSFTATEQRLLEVLMEAGGQALSTAEICLAVFGEADCLNELKVYIRHLRQKIEEPFGIRVIETVRGVGYRFRTERLGGKRIVLTTKR